MKVVPVILVLGVVAVYFYLKNIESSGEDMETRGRIIIPTLAATVVVLTLYTASTAF